MHARTHTHTHTHFRLLGISSVSHDSCQVSQVCCSFYSGQSVQFGEVCLCSTTPFIPRVPYNVMVTVHFSFSFLWGPWTHVKHLLSYHSLSLTLALPQLPSTVHVAYVYLSHDLTFNLQGFSPSSQFNTLNSSQH